MFDNLSRTLSLLRDLSGKSQIELAKEARIGKSQLSKYETGKELPKFDSLEKVLNALGIGYSEFFYALRLVDRLSVEMQQIREAGAGGGDQPLFPAPSPEGAYLLPENTRQAFGQLFNDLLLLHHRMVEESVIPASEAPPPALSKPKVERRGRKLSQRAAASSPPRSASPR